MGHRFSHRPRKSIDFTVELDASPPRLSREQQEDLLKTFPEGFHQWSLNGILQGIVYQHNRLEQGSVTLGMNQGTYCYVGTGMNAREQKRFRELLEAYLALPSEYAAPVEKAS